jgi:crotonobetainyl-CoA:carnitine CoA-transferase CaiB-like acyl-CoA transferase
MQAGPPDSDSEPDAPSPTAPATGPLAGLRILDLTSVVMGPYATQILGDLGADVIKVEPPAGDNLRAVGPMRNAGMGAMALHLNRNKRSIVLDLKQAAAREACLRLAVDCDVFVYNTRPQAMARLGLDHASVAAVNPRIVYLCAAGYGEDGPYAGRPAYDDLIQGATGIAALYAQQTGGPPAYAPVTLADRTVGLQVAIALLAAVCHARATGRGQAVEVPMFEALAQCVAGDHLGGHSFEPPIGPTGYGRLLAAHRRPYRTADGFLCAMVYTDRHWQAFLTLIGRPELLQTPAFASHAARSAHIAEIYTLVAEVMATRSSADWLQALGAADIPVAQLHSVDTLLDDPHLQAVGFFRTLAHPTEGRIRTPAPVGRYSATPPSIHRPTPRTGEHSAELLREAGYGETAIAALMATGASAVPPPGRTMAEAP